MAARSVATRKALVALDFFIGILVNGNDSDCPASGLRSRQLLFLLRSNKNVLFSEHPYHTAMF